MERLEGEMTEKYNLHWVFAYLALAGIGLILPDSRLEEFFWLGSAFCLGVTTCITFRPQAPLAAL